MDKKNEFDHSFSSIVDEKLLIFIEFKDEYDLNGITLYSYLSQSDYDQSPPKQLRIYKSNTINLNINDITNMEHDLSIDCNIDKLNNGQTINFENDKKRFKNTKYLIIYIQSNQYDTNKTYLNNIQFHGNYSKPGKGLFPSYFSKQDYFFSSPFSFISNHTDNDDHKCDGSILEPSTDIEFDDMLNKIYNDKLLVIEFFASWCPHHKRIESQYQRIAQRFKDKGITFMKVDMDKLDKIAKKYDIASTPTFKFIVNDHCLDTIKGANIKNVLGFIEQYIK